MRARKEMGGRGPMRRSLSVEHWLAAGGTRGWAAEEWEISMGQRLRFCGWG